MREVAVVGVGKHGSHFFPEKLQKGLLWYFSSSFLKQLIDRTRWDKARRKQVVKTNDTHDKI